MSWRTWELFCGIWWVTNLNEWVLTSGLKKVKQRFWELGGQTQQPDGHGRQVGSSAARATLPLHMSRHCPAVEGQATWLSYSSEAKTVLCQEKHPRETWRRKWGRAMSLLLLLPSTVVGAFVRVILEWFWNHFWKLSLKPALPRLGTIL